MTRSFRTALLSLVVAGAAVAALVALAGPGRGSAAQPAATPTPYHQGVASPAATPAGEPLHGMPLPSAEDQATANSMTNAGVAMLQAAQGMDAAAAVMLSSGSAELVALGTHWQQDAAALAQRGAWMSISATSDSMVHDPNKARELDLANLRANGSVMELEGQAMVEHGREMIDQVAQLRANGSLPAATADELTARGNDIVEAGERMAADGKRMQDDAERLQRSIGE